MHFMAVKKSRRRSGFVIYSYSKDSTFTTVKRGAEFWTTHMKGIPFVNRKYTKGEQAFSVKKVYKRVRGLDFGAETPHMSTPLEHHLRPNPTQQKLWKSQKFLSTQALQTWFFSHLFGRVACSRLRVRWKKRSRKVAWGRGTCKHCFQ